MFLLKERKKWPLMCNNQPVTQLNGRNSFLCCCRCCCRRNICIPVRQLSVHKNLISYTAWIGPYNDVSFLRQLSIWVHALSCTLLMCRRLFESKSFSHLVPTSIVIKWYLFRTHTHTHTVLYKASEITISPLIALKVQI